jgi:hypothetical protein
MSRKHSAQRVRCYRQNPASKRSTHVLVPSIMTGGELFPDGRSISLVRNSSTGRLKLLLADGNIEIIDSVVKHAGHTYVPPDLADSFQQAIVFPEAARDFGSTTALFTDMKASIMNFGLPEHAALVALYFLLSSWFV